MKRTSPLLAVSTLGRKLTTRTELARHAVTRIVHKKASRPLHLLFLHLLPYLCITSFGLLICLPIISGESLPGHDALFHTYREPSTLNALKDGQLVPQVDPKALDGFGYSWNMFYGPLSSYISTILRLVIPGWPMTLNVFTILTVIASGIFLFRFVREITGRQLPALFAAVIYMAAPYHLIDFYIRQAQGELLSFVFAPLFFHGLYRIVHGKKGVLYTAIAFSGIVLSHGISAIIFLLCACVFLLLNGRSILSKKIVLQLVAAGLICIGVTAFFTLPLLELRSTHLYNIFDSSYLTDIMGAAPEYLQMNTVSIVRLVFNPQSITGSSSLYMPFSLGYITIASFVLLPVAFRYVPAHLRRFLVQTVLLAVVTVYMASELVPWDKLPQFLDVIQFPWRFLVAGDVFMSIVAGISLFYAIDRLLHTANVRYIAFVVVASFAVFSSLGIIKYAAYTQPTIIGYDYSLGDMANLEGQWVDQYVPSSLMKSSSESDSEYRLAPLVDTLKQQPKSPVVIAGKAVIKKYQRDGSHTSFRITTTAETTLELPFIYYPGYAASLVEDGHTTALTTKPSSKGLLTIVIPKGSTGIVETYFGMSRATIAGLLITVCTLLAVMSQGTLRRKILAICTRK